VSKNHLGIDVDHAAMTQLTSPETQGRQGSGMLYKGLVIDRLAQARYRLNFVNNFGE
jgi:hypothetical protein